MNDAPVIDPATEIDANRTAPLAALTGARPPAPAWFEAAVAMAPERSSIEVAGVSIETLVWGERGRPGLLLCHGNGAHADWWSFIAPFFAAHYRVAAFSLSGMGGSGWRRPNSMANYVEEAMTVARVTGLFEAERKPVMVGHSFGGFVTIATAAARGADLGAVVIVDTPLLSREMRLARGYKEWSKRDRRPTQLYGSFQAGLMRFRLLPSQPSENLYILDYIARHSLREVQATEKHPAGWTWRFDPFVFRDFAPHDSIAELKAAKCPVAVMWGEESSLMRGGVTDFILSVAPPGSPAIAIPQAHHHVMLDQPLAFVTALRGLLAGWPAG